MPDPREWENKIAEEERRTNERQRILEQRNREFANRREAEARRMLEERNRQHEKRKGWTAEIDELDVLESEKDVNNQDSHQSYQNLKTSESDRMSAVKQEKLKFELEEFDLEETLNF